MIAHLMTRRTFAAMGGALLASILAGRKLAASPRSLPRRQAASLTGRVIWPNDPAYAEARLTFNSRFSRFPAAIVACSSLADVQNAIRWARQNDLPIRARSGGHSYEAFSSVDGGLVVDVSGLSDVNVDLARGEAVVGAGVRLLDLYRRLSGYGVTVPGGTCGGVGIAGLTLGGGIGFLSRQYGLTCDNLLAVDLVDANGNTLLASEQEHPDLFWALRGGGGGNFGIATSFTFRVHPIGEVTTVSVTWPWDDAPAVIDAWQHWAPAVDERLTTGFSIGPPSDGSISAYGVFNGPAAELPSLLAPLLAAGTPSAPRIASLPYLSAADQLAGPGAAHSLFKNASAFAYEPLSSHAIAMLLDHLRAAPTDANLVGFFPLGGTVADIAPAATAFPHRRALFDLKYQAYWSDPAEESPDAAWVNGIRDAMAPYTRGAYVNYVDASLPDWATAYYGVNLARLSRVKQRFDPDNVFDGPQTVPGEGG